MPPVEAALSRNDIYTAVPIVEIEGQVNDMVQTLFHGMDMVESERGMSAMELRFFNSATVDQEGNDFAFEYADNTLLSIGNSLRVLAGDQIDPQELFLGTITGIEIMVERDQQPVLTVLAEDALQKARMTRRTCLHSAGSVQSIVQAVASDLGISAQVSGLNDSVDAQLQFNESDLAFLRRLLDRFDADLQIVGNSLQVSPRTDIRRNELALQLNSQLLSIRACADLAHQVSRITFAGWDFAAGREIQVQNNASADAGPGQGRTGSTFVGDAVGERLEHLPHVNVQNQAEAQALVNACYAQRTRRFVRAEGLAVGNPNLRVGTHVTLQGIGPRFENTYYVTETHHRYDTTHGYQTQFKAECAFLGG